MTVAAALPGPGDSAKSRVSLLCRPGRIRGMWPALRFPHGPGTELDKDRVMASHGTTEYSVAEGNDYPAHEQTYLNFLALVKWGIIVVVLILIGMAYFLV
jgi:hypothetical protein